MLVSGALDRGQGSPWWLSWIESQSDVNAHCREEPNYISLTITVSKLLHSLDRAEPGRWVAVALPRRCEPAGRDRSWCLVRVLAPVSEFRRNLARLPVAIWMSWTYEVSWETRIVVATNTWNDSVRGEKDEENHREVVCGIGEGERPIGEFLDKYVAPFVFGDGISTSDISQPVGGIERLYYWCKPPRELSTNIWTTVPQRSTPQRWMHSTTKSF